MTAQRNGCISQWAIRTELAAQQTELFWMLCPAPSPCHRCTCFKQRGEPSRNEALRTSSYYFPLMSSAGSCLLYWFPNCGTVLGSVEPWGGGYDSAEATLYKWALESCTCPWFHLTFPLPREDITSSATDTITSASVCPAMPALWWSTETWAAVWLSLLMLLFVFVRYLGHNIQNLIYLPSGYKNFPDRIAHLIETIYLLYIHIDIKTDIYEHVHSKLMSSL